MILYRTVGYLQNPFQELGILFWSSSPIRKSSRKSQKPLHGGPEIIEALEVASGCNQLQPAATSWSLKRFTGKDLSRQTRRCRTPGRGPVGLLLPHRAKVWNRLPYRYEAIQIWWEKKTTWSNSWFLKMLLPIQKYLSSGVYLCFKSNMLAKRIRTSHRPHCPSLRISRADFDRVGLTRGVMADRSHLIILYLHEKPNERIESKSSMSSSHGITFSVLQADFTLWCVPRSEW